LTLPSYRKGPPFYPYVGIDAVEPADNLGRARRLLREDSGKVPRRDLHVDRISLPPSDHLPCDAMALLSLSMGDPERHVAIPDPERRARLNQRLRLAFMREPRWTCGDCSDGD
jgi:hypothetical protein